MEKQETYCGCKSTRTLTPAEAETVGTIPETKHDVSWEPFQLCLDCGRVFADGRLEGFPIMLIAGHYKQSDNGPIWQPR